ncbi:MAG: hypothetical protein HC933_20955 [Pleurocapsa sp. SU_196_0]|nr:hypothetical protein [Pleurocapsa sp. SU_196_0]
MVIARTHEFTDALEPITYMLGISRFAVFDLKAAHTHVSASLEHWRKQGEPFSIGGRLMVLGNIEYFLERPADARVHLEEALEIALEKRLLTLLPGTHSTLGIIYAEQGELEAARQQLEGILRSDLDLNRTPSPLNTDWLMTAISIASAEARHARSARLAGVVLHAKGEADHAEARMGRKLLERITRKSRRILGKHWDPLVDEGRGVSIDTILAMPEPRSNRTHQLLSPREWQVIKLVDEGLSDLEIAAKLGLRPRTITRCCCRREPVMP